MTARTENSLIIGTRRSPMAIVFAEEARRRLNAADSALAVDIATYVSEGDKITGSLAEHGGKGTFVKDLERRLLAGEVDCAVHSLKDIPGDMPMHEGLAIAAYLPRHDPSDCLVLREGVTEDRLHQPGARIGTSAPRRRASLRRLYPLAQTELVRGNVNTRLRKLSEGQYDALVLAFSGLSRLGMEDVVTRRLSSAEMLPAIGQGIMCLQIRRADLQRWPAFAAVNDDQAAFCAAAEREILLRLKGNCHSAIAGLCRLDGGEAVLEAKVYKPDTDIEVAASSRMAATDAAALGQRVAQDLLAQGAAKLL